MQGLKGGLKDVGLEFEGREHSGIEDARLINRVDLTLYFGLDHDLGLELYLELELHCDHYLGLDFDLDLDRDLNLGLELDLDLNFGLNLDHYRDLNLCHDLDLDFTFESDY